MFFQLTEIVGLGHHFWWLDRNRNATCHRYRPNDWYRISITISIDLICPSTYTAETDWKGLRSNLYNSLHCKSLIQLSYIEITQKLVGNSLNHFMEVKRKVFKLKLEAIKKIILIKILLSIIHEYLFYVDSRINFLFYINLKFLY